MPVCHTCHGTKRMRGIPWGRASAAYNSLADAVHDQNHSAYCNELLHSLLESRICTAHQQTEAHLAQLVAQNNSETLDEYLSINKIDLTEFDVFSFISHISTDTKIIEVLLKHHAIANFAYERSNTILHWACQTNNLKLVELLFLQGNVDINIRNEDNLTPIECALKHNHQTVVEYLAKCGAVTPDGLKSIRIYTKREHLHFLANLVRSDCEQVWTNFSEAVFSSDVQFMKEALIQNNGCCIDTLTLYCAVSCDNFEVFNKIWCSASAEIIEGAARLMSIAFTEWTQAQDVVKFKIVLSTNNVNLNLHRCGHDFVTFIRTIIASNNWADNDIYELIKLFAKKHLRLTWKHFIALVEYTWDKSASRRKLLQCVLEYMLPNVTLSVLINSFSRDLNELFVPYCFELNVDSVFKLLCNCNPDELVKMYAFFVQFFTLPEHKEDNFRKLLMKIDKKMVRHISQLPKRNNNCVKSLLELSRDRFRLHLTQVLYSTCQFIKYLEQLSAPVVIKNILQFKIALYI